MLDRPLNDSEYDDDDEPVRIPDTDPLSQALGSPAYLQHHTVQECVERFDGPIARFPEVFDRFYFLADGGPVLVDVLMDGTPEQLELERDRKRVAFKAAWCAQNGRRYLPLPESVADQPERVRALLAEDARNPETVSAPETPAARKAPRGRVQRPKATA